jgi:hypothetical protein
MKGRRTSVAEMMRLISQLSGPKTVNSTGWKHDRYPH